MLKMTRDLGWRSMRLGARGVTAKAVDSRNAHQLPHQAIFKRRKVH